MKKKLIKLFFLLLIIILVYDIYAYGKTSKIYYVSIGDKLSVGMNPYDKISYGYSDYLKDYFLNNKEIQYYKDYTKSAYTIDKLKEDINNKLELKKDLRESDLVTLSIGINDLLYSVDFDIENEKEIILNIILKLDTCLKEIRKYAKEKIIIIGYYNPFIKNNKTVDNIFAYIDDEYLKLAKKYNCEYLSIYENFQNNSEYLVETTNIHPTNKGYMEIANQIIIKLIKKTCIILSFMVY